MPKSIYKRVLLKLSGESLKGESPSGIDHKACQQIAKEICEVYEIGVQMGIVIGGGNIFRGSQAKEFGFARTPADHIGMLSTTINGLLLSQTLESLGCKTRVMSALHFDGIVDVYHWNQAMLYLEKGVIVVFVGGTGNPYFTTDTAAAMRGSEIAAEVLLKATKVDGIYNKDPMQYADAEKYDTLTYAQALTEDLKVMDAAAIALCRENHIPIHVFNVFVRGSLLKAVCKKSGGTIVK